MDISYEQLNGGYILQKGDKLVLHGINYNVMLTRPNDGHLSNSEGASSRVFDILGMGAEERKNFVKKFNPVNYGEAQGAFPEFSDLKTLTDLVIALYEIPEYEIGEWVTVLPRASDSYEPIIYADEMVGYAGKTFQVKKLHLRSATPKCNEVDSGDPHSYDLDGAGYHWTSQMIRKATEEEIRKAKGETEDRDTEKLKAQIEELKKSVQSHLGTVVVEKGIQMYAPLYKNTPEDTEIRLPNNEEEIPHIKL